MEAKTQEVRDWLVREWSGKLCLILESMVDQLPTVLPFGDSESAVPDPGAVIWSQTFAAFDGPAVFVAASASASIDLGRRTLAAAGVETVEESECQSTFLELLSQSMSALGVSISANWNCRAQAGQGEEITAAPKGVLWVPVIFEFEGTQVQPMWFAASVVFMERLMSGAASEAAAVSALEVSTQTESQGAEPAMGSGSKTFNLLLDVALPVSISFGRTLLPIKEVLRLASGSIVELDRAINEPVEVIVNNCVIARGEVVVIEGNYGVRIQEIASRYDRLRTGTGATQSQHALPGK